MIIVSFEVATGNGCLGHYLAELNLIGDAGMHAILKQSWLRLVSMLEPNSILSNMEFDSRAISLLNLMRPIVHQVE